MNLNFYETPPGAYVEYYDKRPTNVLIIHEGYEQTKDRPSNYDYIVCTIFQPFDIHYGDSPIGWNRRMNEDSWLVLGISDWEEVIQVPKKEVYRYIIRGTFEENGIK